MQPDVVEKLVGLREGIPKKDAKEVNCLSTSLVNINLDGKQMPIFLRPINSG